MLIENGNEFADWKGRKLCIDEDDVHFFFLIPVRAEVYHGDSRAEILAGG